MAFCVGGGVEPPPSPPPLPGGVGGGMILSFEQAERMNKMKSKIVAGLVNVLIVVLFKVLCFIFAGFRNNTP
jgi:hypothetical protein